MAREEDIQYLADDGAWALLYAIPGSHGFEPLAGRTGVLSMGAISRWSNQAAAEWNAADRRAQGMPAIVVPWSEALWVDDERGGRSCSIASPTVLCNQTIVDALNRPEAAPTGEF